MRYAAILALALSACGGAKTMREAMDASMLDASSAIDAAQLTLDPPTPASPAPPAPALLPIMTPCRAGWMTVTSTSPEGVLTTCEPWPDGTPHDCGSLDHARFVADGACTLIGAACISDWPTGLTQAIFVKPNAPQGGTGTQDAPFSTIAEAMRHAPQGSIIALSRGTHAGGVMLRTGVEIRGACVQDTVVTATSAHTGTFTSTHGAATLRNLRIAGGASSVLVSGSSTALELDDVAIDQTAGIAVIAGDGARLIISRLLLRGTKVAPDGGGGIAMLIHHRATAHLSSVVFLQNQLLALVAGAGAIVAMTDTAILDTLPAPDGSAGVAMFVGASTLSLEGGVIEDARFSGALIGEPETHLSLTDVLIRRTLARGVDIEGGASADLTRVSILNPVGDAIAIAQGSLNVTDAVVRGAVHGSPLGDDGVGIAVSETGTTTLSRVLLERNEGGITVIRRHHLYATDIVVRDPPAGAVNGGRGVELDLTSGRIERAHLARNGQFGIVAYGSTSSLALYDVIIEDTRPFMNTSQDSAALVATEGAHLELHRGILARNPSFGLLSGLGGSMAVLEDVEVTDTAPRVDGIAGRGVQATQGGTVTLSRVLLARNHEISALALMGGHIEGSDVLIQDTMAGPDGLAGVGVSAQVGSTVSLVRAVIQNSVLAGAYATVTSTLSLTDATIRDTQSRADGLFGRGIDVEQSSTVFLTRTIVEHNREIGIAAATQGTRVSVDQVIVRDTIERACAASTCSGFGEGVGVVVFLDASFEAQRFLLENNVLAGLQLVRGGQADLRDGEIAYNPIGINLQVTPYDVKRLSNGVVFVGNGRNLDADSLPIPDAVSGL
jgi:hypothetical protein